MQLTMPSEPARAVRTAMSTLRNFPKLKEGDPPLTPPSMEGNAESIKEFFVVIGFCV
jgi:hypothetical protein